MLSAEADARYGAFDFRAAHDEAPDDLRDLLDSHESLVSRSQSPWQLPRVIFYLPSPSAEEDTNATGC